MAQLSFFPTDWTHSDLHVVKGCLFPSSFQRFTQHPLPDTMIRGRNREGKQNLDPAPPLTSGISVFVLSGKIGLKYKWSKRYWWYQNIWIGLWVIWRKCWVVGNVDMNHIQNTKQPYVKARGIRASSTFMLPFQKPLGEQRRTKWREEKHGEEMRNGLRPTPESCHAVTPSHQENHQMVWFPTEMNQSDGQTQTYSSHFAMRSGAHREHCL